MIGRVPRPLDTALGPSPANPPPDGQEPLPLRGRGSVDGEVERGPASLFDESGGVALAAPPFEIGPYGLVLPAQL